MSLLRFASLGSGSRGNATLVEWSCGSLMVDCGFSLRETKLRLLRLGKSPESINALLVTHEHSDHIKGVSAFARCYRNTHIYMTSGTWHSRDFGDLPNLHLIEDYKPFVISELKVIPVAVPHDAREPSQFIFEHRDKRLGILTDLGSITTHVEDQYQNLDAMLLEANHDSFMLVSGSYPYSLKQRVGGAWGHLSNQQAAGLLQRIDCSRLQHLVLAHISLQNNRLDLAQTAIAPVASLIKQITFACQEQGFGWLSVE